MLAEDYTRYLEEYCKKFGLYSSILVNTSVTKVKRAEDGSHVIHYLLNNGQMSEWQCDAVAICSGLHVLPNTPRIYGLRHLPTVMHSSEFKEKKQFGVAKNVLILGSGKTGMDLAYMAVTSDTKSVTLSHRDGFHCGLKACHPFLSPVPFS